MEIIEAREVMESEITLRGGVLIAIRETAGGREGEMGSPNQALSPEPGNTLQPNPQPGLEPEPIQSQPEPVWLQPATGSQPEPRSPSLPGTKSEPRTGSDRNLAPRVPQPQGIREQDQKQEREAIIKECKAEMIKKLQAVMESSN